MGDVCSPTNPNQQIWVNFFNTIGFTGNVGLRYNIKNRHYVSGALFLGQLYAEDPINNYKYWYRGLRMSTLFTEASARYEFIIMEEKKRTTVYRQLGQSPLKNLSLPTYLFVGAGATFNAGNSTRITKDGKQVITENFRNFTPVIPFGIGVKYRINKLTYINLEAAWRVALSDGLDNAIGTDSNIYGKWIDQYQTITINFIHKLRQNQNGTPKFRSR